MSRKCVVALLTLMLWALPSAVSAEPNLPGSPQLLWEVGDSWTVKTWPPYLANTEDRYKQHFAFPGEDTASEDVEFRVLRRCVERNVKCFEISAKHPKDRNGFQLGYLLYYREDTGSLIKIRDDTLLSTGTRDMGTRDEHFDLQPDVPCLELDPFLIPFQMPVWSAADTVVSKSHDAANRHEEREQKQRQVALSREYRLYTKAVTDFTSGRSSVEEREVIQIWDSGNLWYSKAEVYVDGNLLSRVYLVSQRRAPNK